MAEMKTKLQEFVQDPERHRIFEQESLAIEATELISTLLKERQVNKAELAKRIGKSKAYVTQLLSGGRNMTLHTFADLAFALGYKVELQASPLSKSGEVTPKRQRHEAVA
jgi:transcriptional regulator with XRE-family HTH domain